LDEAKQRQESKPKPPSGSLRRGQNPLRVTNTDDLEAFLASQHEQPKAELDVCQEEDFLFEENSEDENFLAVGSSPASPAPNSTRKRPVFTTEKSLVRIFDGGKKEVAKSFDSVYILHEELGRFVPLRLLQPLTLPLAVPLLQYTE
jgi:hypothetical protein